MQPTSVLITTYPARYAGVDQILRAWLRQPAAQLWLLDGGGAYSPPPEVRRDPRFAHFALPFDPGPRIDYAMATLTDGDFLCLADDDVEPAPGFLEDLAAGERAVGGGIVGIIGRTFEGTRYKGQTTFYRSSLIDAPVRVGFAGVVLYAARDLFGFDTRGMPRNCDDLWFQMKHRTDTPKWVVPTKAYLNLPSCKDGSAMYRNPELIEQRQEFYADHYLRLYAPAGRRT